MKTTVIHASAAANAKRLPLPNLEGLELRPAASSHDPHADLRRAPRVAADAKALLEPLGTYAASGQEQVIQEVFVRDVNRCGAQLVHRAPVYPGERCQLTIGRAARLPVEIAWCRRLGPGVFASGCEFVG